MKGREQELLREGREKWRRNKGNREGDREREKWHQKDSKIMREEMRNTETL